MTSNIKISKMEKQQKLEIVKNAIKSYPNFPKPGIIFRDIFSIFCNINAMKALKDLLISYTSNLEIDAIVGLDSRGFLLGPLISMEIEKPFFPIRKKGKLPGKVLQESYSLEYGESVFEIQTDQLSQGMRVLIVDDLLATGGSMKAATQLLTKLGTKIIECLVVIELTGLKGRQRIGVPIQSLIQFD
ncbi:adenine phosphoribosyltransferase [Prorops nasuta]|uniref:adenine phosphoribosyltransferase n=1 Tax=Prorops nasuta TaxID=863751 RepID=UPI0034CE6BA6